MSSNENNHGESMGNPFDIQDVQERRVFNTRGGQVTKGTMSIGDLLAHVELTTRPAQPWSNVETHQRWEQSEESGHLQLVLKCDHCSLEFIVLTLRSKIEALEAYQPSHGEHGGACPIVTCPECGHKGASFLLGYGRQPGTICQYVTSKLNHWRMETEGQA